MSPMRRGTWFCAFAGGRCWFFLYLFPGQLWAPSSGLEHILWMMWMIQILISTRPCSCATTLDWWFSQISLKACKVVRLVVFNLIAVGEERLSKHWNVENGSRVNPGERLGAIGIEEVRRHPWFDSLNWPGRANSSCWFWKWWTWIRLYAYFNFSSGQAKLFACNDVECNINSGIHCCSLRFKKATFDSTFYSGHKVSNNLSSDLTFSLVYDIRQDLWGHPSVSHWGSRIDGKDDQRRRRTDRTVDRLLVLIFSFLTCLNMISNNLLIVCLKSCLDTYVHDHDRDLDKMSEHDLDQPSQDGRVGKGEDVRIQQRPGQFQKL